MKHLLAFTIVTLCCQSSFAADHFPYLSIGNTHQDVTPLNAGACSGTADLVIRRDANKNPVSQYLTVTSDCAYAFNRGKVVDLKPDGGGGYAGRIENPDIFLISFSAGNTDASYRSVTFLWSVAPLVIPGNTKIVYPSPSDWGCNGKVTLGRDKTGQPTLNFDHLRTCWKVLTPQGKILDIPYDEKSDSFVGTMPVSDGNYILYGDPGLEGELDIRNTSGLQK